MYGIAPGKTACKSANREGSQPRSCTLIQKVLERTLQRSRPLIRRAGLKLEPARVPVRRSETAEGPVDRPVRLASPRAHYKKAEAEAGE